MMVLEIIGAAAAVITIFSAGVAVGKCISKNQKAKFILANDMAIGLNIDFYNNKLLYKRRNIRYNICIN